MWPPVTRQIWGMVRGKAKGNVKVKFGHEHKCKYCRRTKKVELWRRDKTMVMAGGRMRICSSRPRLRLTAHELMADTMMRKHKGSHR